MPQAPSSVYIPFMFRGEKIFRILRVVFLYDYYRLKQSILAEKIFFHQKTCIGYLRILNVLLILAVEPNRDTTNDYNIDRNTCQTYYRNYGKAEFNSTPVRDSPQSMGADRMHPLCISLRQSYRLLLNRCVNKH